MISGSLKVPVIALKTMGRKSTGMKAKQVHGIISTAGILYFCGSVMVGSLKIYI